jgi:GT2 family glycosyltransferase
MSAPELSVVIVSYRCAELLAECLDSLEANRSDVDMEVMVVDNASGDDTVDIARSYDWVQVEALDENVGFARANNRAMDRSRGRAVLVLNPDTVLPPGSLRACLDYLWQHPDIGLLTPTLVDCEGRLDRRCHRGFPTLWSSFCYFTTLDRVLRNPGSQRYTLGHIPADIPTDVEAVSGAFMLMPADAMRRVGGFDEQFFMYAEDIDLSLRFIEAGYRVHYWPGVSVVHVGAGSNVAGQRPPAANAAYFRTMAPFVRKHRHGVRGVTLAATVWMAGELMLAATEVRRRLHRAGGGH